MLWLKALHLIFMVTWFAGLFYLPRLYVYHAMSDDEISNERFKIMERKLFFGIMTPGMVATLIFGFWMLIVYDWSVYAHAGWLHAKLLLLMLTLIYHYFCYLWLLDFKHDRNRRSHVFYRWMNEVPVLFLVGIVILAVVKPF
ncbi:MAG: protoporphyrinogen oxidase HemJ [Methylobacter sp.]|uniref:Protoporphyrinogen IX oxidase n=1 Tax=Candidatus Methylobacter titanis TaxID=3053457 RepID=A0AA43THR8_9GAMM|nr:protoporphyrinogen oxidase HemJ [Candidatus Methylobacter titanis]MDI1293113.1 protoporphyrinogen oxidase HemJ [Candidatus Methylobacter titanis]